MTKSSTSAPAGKPPKPYEGFPLFAHASGRWAKKVRGALVYFGRWTDDPKGERALNLWLEQRDDLMAGRKPRKPGEAEGVTVKELCDRFLDAKRHLVDTREIAQRSWSDYEATCLRVADAFGRRRVVSDLRPEDFEQLRNTFKGWAPATIFNEIGRVRVLFRYGFESDLLDRPVKFGPGFKRPSQKALRLARAAKGPRMFGAADLRKIIEIAGVQVRAMILLGINSGLGNTDCARLTTDKLDLDKSWLDYPRPKTGVPRRCPLWPETVKALREAIASRPKPKDPAHADLVFITKYGAPWREDGHRNSPLSHEFSKLLDALGLKRPGLNFYAIRHTLETIGSEGRDQPALDLIMGHAAEADDMSAVYRERVDAKRLRAVTDRVRRWLYPAAQRRKTK